MDRNNDGKLIEIVLCKHVGLCSRLRLTSSSKVRHIHQTHTHYVQHLWIMETHPHIQTRTLTQIHTDTYIQDTHIITHKHMHNTHWCILIHTHHKVAYTHPHTLTLNSHIRTHKTGGAISPSTEAHSHTQLTYTHTQNRWSDLSFHRGTPA